MNLACNVESINLFITLTKGNDKNMLAHALKVLNIRFANVDMNYF